MEIIPGTEVVNGIIRLGHLWHEIDAIFDILLRYKINHFVEIGVHHGGLAFLLLRRFPKLNYLGIDINLGFVHQRVKDNVEFLSNAKLIECDCFNPKTLDNVKEWMPKDRNCILYCDNGNKPKEIKTYAPLLRIGDILMAHDYYDGKRVVKNLEEYGQTHELSWPEVMPKDVAFMYEKCKELDKVDLSNTRIIGFIAV